MYTNYNPYSGSTLTHYGVKGMKWGVRRKDRGGSREPRTEWGKNRQYAKQQDAIDRDLWKKTKSDWKQAKKTTELGSVERDAARVKYKAGRDRHSKYNQMRSTYTNDYQMTKAARGKIMKKNGLSAETPVSKLKTSQVLKNNGVAMAKQMGKYTLGSAAVTAAVLFGRKAIQDYVANQPNPITTPSRLLENNTIWLDPKDYKVS